MTVREFQEQLEDLDPNLNMVVRVFGSNFHIDGVWNTSADYAQITVDEK